MVHSNAVRMPKGRGCFAGIMLDNFNGGSWDSNVYFNTSDPGETDLRAKGFCGFSLVRWQSEYIDMHKQSRRCL